ncbi:uncharacterized protein PHACADRAFT_33587 [Phanerochaete carnosa HHB-10118-sp]|uniref:Uncharacterized protein n=1 Tax=Phanerochaete carnosa (strain HHB-10118-sp) TaxID=650164 RepID=K5WG58_PHACS|nr:uncharacterized protein PHACADRAFT_33587 [Phanerochaete carnosa HHB-10118-sp]EKM49187.1 hypothetical protein PHACADRAFT_33587 [Phanerochaete carnosa HHB-10118-sp]
MAGGSKSHRKLGASRQVKKTTHVRSTDAKLHPEARGLRRAVTKTLGLKAQAQEQMNAERRVQELLADVSHETIALLRHGLPNNDCEMQDDQLSAMPNAVDASGQADGWVDENMPVADDFLSAMRDASHSRLNGRWYKQQRRWKLRRS